mgnify:CR=1 FL=1
MTPSDRTASGANFYQRVERQLSVIEADVKDVLARVAVLEEKARTAEKEQDSMGDRIWDVVKYLIIAVLGGVIGAWIKSEKP